MTSRLLGLALLGLSLSGPALAAERTVADRMESITVDSRRVELRVQEISRNFTDRSGLIGATDALERYQEAVYQYLIGDYENAATSFFILVQARALSKEELNQDAQWYLAESLFELDNYRTAIEVYKLILDSGEKHPYFADAARRTLETYAILGDNASFDSFYNAYIVSGRVKATELISYTLAKSFYRRGESGRAKAMFEAVAPGTNYYSRARYFLGVQMISEGNLKQAMDEFTNAEKAPVTDDEHKRVKELAELALARLHYEAGDMNDAMVWYGKVSRNSPTYADQLYESAWTYIKEANVAEKGAEQLWRDAAVQVTLFLETFPQHRYTTSMKILQGHLNMKLEDFDSAEKRYEAVVAEYDPVVARLAAIQGDRAVTERFLNELTDDTKGAKEDLLPGYAEEILLSRPEVKRAATAWGSLQDQRAELAASDELITLLNTALADPSKKLGTFSAARQELESLEGTVLGLQARLLDAEVLALRTAVPARRTELAAVQKLRDGAYADAANAPDIAAAVSKNYAGLRTELGKYRAEVSDKTALQGLDGLWASVETLTERVSQTANVIDEAERREVDAVRSKLASTSERVTELHTTIESQSSGVETLAGAAVQAGVRVVEADFRTDVLVADKGIVDVAWLRKSATTDDIDVLSDEQNKLLKSLDEQYDRLRENAGGEIK